jgi:hypothetical protein
LAQKNSKNCLCKDQSDTADITPSLVAFAKLPVNNKISPGTAAVILHLSNATIEVSEGTSSATVEAVLQALKNIR